MHKIMMPDFDSSRRRLLRITTAAAGAALLPGVADAAVAPDTSLVPVTPSTSLPSVLQSLPISKLAPNLNKNTRAQPPYLLRDFTNNPFLRPVGAPLSKAEQERFKPAATRGRGVDE